MSRGSSLCSKAWAFSRWLLAFLAVPAVLMAATAVPVISIEEPPGVPLESGMGTVIAWGANNWGQCKVPEGLKGVRAIAAGWGHSVALKKDGTVVAWGINDFAKQSTVPPGLAQVTAIAAGGDSTAAIYATGAGIDSNTHKVSVWGYQDYGLTLVPADLPEVTGIAAGYNHIVTLLSNGHVRSWGDTTFGQTKVPATVANVAAVAAGGDHTLALTWSGKVLAWGDNHSSECRVPANLGPVRAVAAGRYHSLALRSDGKVVAWGKNDYGQRDVPADLSYVTAIAAGNEHSVALDQNGSATSWGRMDTGHDARTKGALQSIAAGSYHNLGLRSAVGFFTESQYETTYRTFRIKNTGGAPLNFKSFVFSGDDAADFRIRFTPPKTLAPPVDSAVLSNTYLDIEFFPFLGGRKTAALTITTDDPDPQRQVFVIPLTAYTPPTKAVRAGSNPAATFTYTPLVLDRATGLLVQTITFNGYLPVPNGLSIEVSRMPAGVTLYSSSAAAPGAVEVLYTNRIETWDTAQLTLVYSDPLRRTNWQPEITVTRLKESVPQPGEVAGSLTRVYAVRMSARGPLVDFATVPGGIYVVEYCDDGQTWHASVHRLKAGGTRLAWVDRGQPETQTKPVGPVQTENGRYYRVKRLAVR